MDIWEENIFKSMNSSSRAQPAPELYGRILSEVNELPSARFKRIFAICVVLVFLVNVFALLNLWKTKQEIRPAQDQEVYTSTALISNFKIYE